MNSLRFLTCLKTPLRLGNKAFSTSQILRASLVDNKKVGIIGAPLWKGQTRKGTDEAPQVIRNNGLVKELESYGLQVTDFGDLNFKNLEDVTHNKMKANYALTIGDACQKISQKVADILNSGHLCLTLGGDHSLGMGTLHGHHQVFPNMCVLWIDAHADINTPTSTNSGSMHGMPISFVLNQMKRFRVLLPGFEWIQPFLDSNRLAYIGLRDVELFEKAILDEFEIPYYTTREVDQMGILEVIKKALHHINPKGDRTLHVSFDVDSLDSSFAPSTGTPVPNGLTLREALTIGEEVFKTGNMQSLDIVEVNPKLGDDRDIKTTVQSAFSVIHAFMGKERIGCIRQSSNREGEKQKVSSIINNVML